MDKDLLNFSELRDAEIVARMRKCNYEKFKTLVRMHLSFELDLNTDEFDLPCHEIVYEDKGKVKKWNRLTKKQKHGNVVAAALATGSAGCAAVVVGSKSGSGSNSSCNIDSPTEGLSQYIDAGFLFHLQELKDFLMLDRNLLQEGIFRKTGSVSRQNELRAQIQNDKPLNLEGSGYSAHDCATVFKGYLAELPEPLLTDAHYPAHLQIAPLCVGINAHIDDKLTKYMENTTISTNNTERAKKELHVLSSIQLLLLLLPDENRQLLQHIIEMLHAVALKHSANRMSPDNLATLFAPHLICPRNLPPEALHYLAKKLASVIAYMIIRGQDIFSVPAKLATDIKAYFLERKRKKTMSPEINLDESISDISTVNTVYTFVDREKTAAAHNTNTTDTELAQLYAHIQSLPESSKKRRLIKQFNKQNGQGTPLQLQAMNRIKNSETSRPAKSLSDSIKKHIFHKGIMSRTPKRQPLPVVLPETPNNSSMTRHKQRVLFQSPNPHTLPTTSFSAALSSTITNPANNSHTPYNIKSHPLQKSISSSSLLINQQHGINPKPNLPKLLLNEEQESSLSSASNLNSSHSNTNLSQSNQSNSSSDGIICKTKSSSAPVSRQTSSDLQNHANISMKSVCTSLSSLSSGFYGVLSNKVDENYSVTPSKLVAEVAKNVVVSDVDKKSVAWDNALFIDIEHSSQLSTPLKQAPSNDLNSRYKSEPNLSLSHIICDTPNSSNTNVQGTYEMITPIAKHISGKSLTRKLMKGVSMGNLKFPFSTPESTRRLVRTVSSTLMRRSSDDSQLYQKAEGSFAATVKKGNAPLLHDMDDDEIDCCTPKDEPLCDTDSETEVDTDENDNDLDDDDNENLKKNVSLVLAENGGSSSSSSTEMINCFAGGPVAYQQLLLQQSGIYNRNLNLVTSTPSLLLGRRSMSPITKSTQRMPKAMQESIMTPRSRKPVMVLTTTTSSTDQNQTINPTDLSIYSAQNKHSDVNDEEVDEDTSKSDTDEENSNNGRENIVDSSLYPRRYSTDYVTPNPEIINEDATSLGSFSDIVKRRQLLQVNQSFVQQNSIAVNRSSNSQTNSTSITNTDALTENFKEYLLTRSVLTAPPEDTSFTSHSDDFNSSHEIEELDDNQLSSSLLYCLDGNRPEPEIITDSDATNTDTMDGSTETIQTDEIMNLEIIRSNTPTYSTVNSTKDTIPKVEIISTSRLANNPFVIYNNARKRAATTDFEKNSSTLFNNFAHTSQRDSHKSSSKTNQKFLNKDANNLIIKNNDKCELLTNTRSSSNKENFENNENFVVNKKLLRNDYPEETLF